MALGAGLGNLGMPDGQVPVMESSSPFYLLGQLLTAVAPMNLDIAADIRDIASNVANGKILTPGTILNILGLIPVVGSVDSTYDIRKVTQNWISAFPSKRGEAVKLLSDALIKHLPESVGARVLGAITDVPASKLNEKGIPMDEILKYSDQGVNYQQVMDLRSKGVPADDIQKYVDKGINLNRGERLRNSGLPPRATKYVLLNGPDPQRINKLRSQDVPINHILHFYDNGTDLKQVSKLRSQGVPSAEIKQYINLGADL